ncbi:MAG: SUMF1/EgtB/PvdO family nonheme iron enzyme [Planctomycetes bacterium]|jgi:formylglycine-generating enzyme required for sulfatase activity|nr:SUMF1/EgtB/PvdO family nonheme iron enzyme [Planctomycetota bacterium]
MQEKAQPTASPRQQPAIFVNYRRDDCGAAAQHLAEDLQRKFGTDQVFFDRRSIEPGATWPEEIRAALAAACVVVVCIGPRWHLQQNTRTGQNRLDEPGDWVREELRAAAPPPSPVPPTQPPAPGRVLPVLLDDCSHLPDEAITLREDIRYLNQCQAIPLRSGNERDGGLSVLVAAIKQRGVPELAAALQRPMPAADLLARYRQAMVAAHGKLIPFHPDLQERLLAEVCVEVELCWDHGEHESASGRSRAADGGRGQRAGGRTGQGTLREALLEPDPEDADAAAGKPIRLLVLGEPGAGKSTLARNLVRTLAAEPEPVWLPVFVPLGQLRERELDPFAFAAHAALPHDAPAAADLARLLRERAGQGEVVFLFDGLDEADPKLVDGWLASIGALAASLPCPIALLARPIATEGRRLGTEFVVGRVQPLSATERERLIRCLLSPGGANELLDEVARSASLAGLCCNPLLLTLAAIVAEEAMVERRPIPTRRRELYEQAIRLLLRRGYGLASVSVLDPTVAMRWLQRLSLQLHEGGGELWTREQVDAAIWKVRRGSEDLDFQLKSTWATNDAFLQDVGTNAGVLGPHDGLDAWRYLHRSLREWLVAACLADGGAAEWQVRIEAWKQEVAKQRDKEGARERWGEVFAMLCGMVRAPLEVLAAVRAASPELARRALLSVEPLPVGVGLGFALEDPHVDGDLLLRLVRNWGLAATDVETVLLAKVAPDTAVERLGAILYVLDAIGKKPQRPAFFAKAGRPVERAPRVAMVEVPAGSFWMGSPPDEAERNDSEGPQRRVRVPAFSLGATAVTVPDYRCFDPQGTRRGSQGDPVVMVSWWEAYVYCWWLGEAVRLPTEAEWEYACRAGTTTPFSFGLNITPELVNYDGNYPYADGKKGEDRNRSVTVGTLPSNAWGLHEMHGNVLEWCEDWFGDYEKAPTDAAAQQTDHGSGRRVLRGGSWQSTAGRCRSAYRGGRPPGDRRASVGFRPASSSP